MGVKVNKNTAKYHHNNIIINKNDNQYSNSKNIYPSCLSNSKQKEVPAIVMVMWVKSTKYK
jgi:hypothetical protein